MQNPIEIRERYDEVMDFTLRRKVGNDFLPYDFSGYNRVFLKRKSTNGKTDAIDTVNNPTELTVLSAPDGTVRLTPLSDYWIGMGPQVEIWFEVVLSGRIYMFPTRPRDNIIVNISED
jgi:hypothetical protein